MIVFSETKIESFRAVDRRLCPAQGPCRPRGRHPGLSRETQLGEAVHLFLYDTPKVLPLLVAIVAGVAAAGILMVGYVFNPVL